jgi:hypothetical protein
MSDFLGLDSLTLGGFVSVYSHFIETTQSFRPPIS